MVYKVCKGGVRTGNTLRGLHSQSSNKYGRHACLIGSSSMTGRDVTKMVTRSTDDVMVTDTVQSTDVILSLNKKQRWLLPATMRHMIKSGYFGSKAKVSLLERHKLKKRANCVSFVCNKGKTTAVHPKQKRYFSFNLNTSDQETSNRLRKKLALEAARKIKKNKVIKGVINTFTMAGAVPSTQLAEQDIGIASTEPEYRMEVFYPCPKTCSLTFNPKYTDVMIDTNENGKQEVKSVKQPDSSKNRRHHRQRFQLSTWGAFEEKDIDEDVDDMWSDIYSEDCKEENTSRSPDVSEVAALEPSERLHDSLWSKLLQQAEKAERLFVPKTARKKAARKVSESVSNSENKSHIVHISREKDSTDESSKNTDTEPEQTTEHIEMVDSKLPSFRIIAPTEETATMTLQNKFGRMYAEANCEPRRFIINITDDVRNIVYPTKTTTDNSYLTSFLVFTYDGFYDNGLEAFRVSFNSYLFNDSQHLDNTVPFKKYTIDEIVNQMLGLILDMKIENKIDLPERHFSKRKPEDFLSYIRSELKVNVDSFHTKHEINNLSLEDKDILKLDQKLDRLAFDEDFELFCQICYESVRPNQTDSVTFTSLLKCGHIFCDECWRGHSLTKIANGCLEISCPGYDCDVIVDPITLLSLVNVKDVGLLLQRQQEDKLETSEDAQWCPNPSCGRVIKMKVNRKSAGLCYDVTCACGTSCCFSCLGDPHWPARCDQAGSYANKVDDIELPVEVEEEHTKNPPATQAPKSKKKPKETVMMVEGRLCPRCKRFINKNGGCPYMFCKCRYEFCWTCMLPYGHPAPCNPASKLVDELTRTIAVRHIDPKDIAPQPLEPKQKEPVVVKEKSRQRTSMYQKAKQQRLESSESHPSNKALGSLALKIAKAASKDGEFMKQISQLCTDNGDSPSEVHESHDQLVPITRKAITKFLQSCDLQRKALHHVVEFTFVLLHDLPASEDKRRALALANDLSGFTSFFRSILEGGDQQQARTVVKRLVDIQGWSRRALGTLVNTVNRLKATSTSTSH